MDNFWKYLDQIVKNKMLMKLNFPSREVGEASLLLLEYSGVDSKQIEGFQDDLRTRIHDHLLEVGKKSSPKYFGYRSAQIANICEEAIPLLKQQSLGYIFSSAGKKYKFEQRWLSNVSRLLPEDPQVIQVIPYLLICYLMTISKNQFDPFDGPFSEGSCGWLLVFPNDTKSLQMNYEPDSGGSNRSKTIKTICNHFILPPDSKSFSFLYAMYPEKVQLFLPCYVRKRKVAKASENSKTTKESKAVAYSKRKAQFSCLECWEYFRQFACFCKACSNISEVNISLSTALFSSIWDISSVCRADCTNPVCEQNSDMCSSPNSLKNLVHNRFTWSKILHDAYREDILKILHDSYDDSIQKYVDELAYQVLWKALSNEDYEKYMTDSWDSFINLLS